MRPLSEDIELERGHRATERHRRTAATAWREGSAVVALRDGLDAAAVWRPETAASYTSGDLRRMTGGFARSLPGFMELFREVPGEYWQLDVNRDGCSEAVVSCPCGHDARVEVGLYAPCDAKGERNCPRWFFYLHPRVYVAFTPEARDQPGQ